MKSISYHVSFLLSNILHNCQHMLNCKINGTVHIFFLKNSYLSPRWTKLPQFFFYGSFPIIFSCYKWVLSRLGPLHGQNWRNVSKKCLFGCPKPKSRKMTNLYPYSTGHLEQKMILFGFFHQHKYTKYWWKNLKTQLPFVKFGCGIGVKLCHTF